jgi:hypothetical protein
MSRSRCGWPLRCNVHPRTRSFVARRNNADPESGCPRLEYLIARKHINAFATLCRSLDGPMGYSPGALQQLDNFVATRVPKGGRILDIGSQDINPAAIEELRSLAARLHGERAETIIAERFRTGHTWKVADLFQDSPYYYRCVDLYPGNLTIEADLNTFTVPDEHRGSFDLIANLGSTEHILDQVNSFRCIHDFAKVGCIFWHSVPTIGYYNHSLFNYHPLFFVFLARANAYYIEAAGLSAPHSEFTIPASNALGGTEAWSGIRQVSGIVTFVMRKTADRPFQLFTDYDRSMMNATDEDDAWSEMLAGRYDLRVR